MATIKEIAPRPWRERYRLARFKGAYFHVEQQGRSSGRRTVVHEYPKRDEPYSEDMGRHAIRYQMTGYVIEMDKHMAMYQDYQEAKNRLIVALEGEDAGQLVDPYMPPTMHLTYAPLLFMCERYSVTESRERGGYAIFEMLFVEAGIAGNSGKRVEEATGDKVKMAVNEMATVSAEYLNDLTKSLIIPMTPTPWPATSYVAIRESEFAQEGFAGAIP